MLGIYLLVTIFSQLSPQNLLFTPPAGPAQITVAFADLNGVKVGSSVIAEGRVVGSVSRIMKAEQKSRLSKFTVEVSIDPLHRSNMRKGTIALIASHMTTAKASKAPVVELIVPKETDVPLSNGATISGFSSCEEFWKSAEQV